MVVMTQKKLEPADNGSFGWNCAAVGLEPGASEHLGAAAELVSTKITVSMCHVGHKHHDYYEALKVVDKFQVGSLLAGALVEPGLQ